MYTVSKGPSKILNRTRRGKLETLESARDVNRKSSSEPSPSSSPELSSPRPVFSAGRQHGRRKQSPSISPQHRELILYLTHTWRRIEERYEKLPNTEGADINSVYYEESQTHPALEGFQPFNLEAWLGKRLYQQLTGTS